MSSFEDLCKVVSQYTEISIIDQREHETYDIIIEVFASSIIIENIKVHIMKSTSVCVEELYIPENICLSEDLKNAILQTIKSKKFFNKNKNYGKTSQVFIPNEVDGGHLGGDPCVGHSIKCIKQEGEAQSIGSALSVNDDR